MAQKKYKCINLYDAEARKKFLDVKIKFMNKENFKASDQNIVSFLCDYYLSKGGKDGTK